MRCRKIPLAQIFIFIFYECLLKNGFFLPNLPIGEFAYQKIDELFRKLNERQYDDADEAQIRQEISIIGEPYLREQLYRLLRINS